MARVNMKRFSRELMGKPVRFSKILVRLFVDSSQTWRDRYVFSKERSTGWIVGVRWLLTGKTEHSNYDLSTFRETGPRILAYMVAPLPTVEPIPVPPDAIELLPDGFEPEFINRETRELLSKDSVNWPRDKSGKFAKVPPVKR